MLTLIKAPKAESDLIDIWLYVAEDQPVNADRLLDRLNEAALLIAETPGMGVDRPHLSKNLKASQLEITSCITELSLMSARGATLDTGG